MLFLYFFESRKNTKTPKHNNTKTQQHQKHNSFARFMEFKAVNYIFPEWNVWQQFIYSVQGLAFDRDGMKTTHPVEQEVRVSS